MCISMTYIYIHTFSKYNVTMISHMHRNTAHICQIQCTMIMYYDDDDDDDNDGLWTNHDSTGHLVLCPK